MSTPLQQYAADQQFLLAAAAETAGLADPVAFDPDEFATPLLGAAVRGPVLPVAGSLVRDWDRGWPKYWPGVRFGVRVYAVEGVRFVRVQAAVDDGKQDHGYQFYAVARADYRRLFRVATRLKRTHQPAGPPPVLPADVLATVRQNSVDFLDADNLQRVRALGGRPKRGLLFTGPPGNGKTSACRWILQQCAAAG